MLFGGSIITMVMGVIIVLMSITVHELSHGYAAYKLGDPTAKNQGRLTLNPIKHLDPIGALLLFVVGFGWAKPVPVNPYYFTCDRQKGMMLVSIAGPAANFILAFLCAILLHLLERFDLLSNLSYYFFLRAIVLNVYLAIFNLIPIPPLDGSKILAGFLPQATAYKFLSTMEQYGFLILFALILFNITDIILVPIAQVVINAMMFVASFLG